MVISPAALMSQIGRMVSGRSSSSEPDPEKSPSVPYEPLVIDIIVVRTMLVRRLRLPLDIIESILDYGEYWAHSTNSIDYMEEHKSPLRIMGSSQSEDKFLVSPLHT